MRIFSKRQLAHLALTISFALVVSTIPHFDVPHAAAQPGRGVPQRVQPTPTPSPQATPRPAGAGASEDFGRPRAGQPKTEEVFNSIPPVATTQHHQDKVNQQELDKARRDGKEWLVVLLIAAAIATALLLANRSLNRVNAEKLSEEGPQLPKEFNMSDFKLKAFAKGDWPLYIDYELERPGNVTLKVEVKDRPDFEVVFDGKGPGRWEQLIRLPATLGDQPQVGTFSITARKGGRRSAKVPLIIYALGAGDKAVASPGFDIIEFKPDEIVVDRSRASYTFRSRRDFSKVAADFMLLSRDQSGEIISSRVNQQPFDRGARSGESQGGVWDGKTSESKASRGTHQLAVRGWFGLGEGGDWALSESPPPWVTVK